MTFSKHLKALSSKAEAKLQKVKVKCRLHKTKAARKADAAGKTNSAGKSNAVTTKIMAEDNTPKAAVNTKAADNITEAAVNTNAEVKTKAKIDPIIKVNLHTIAEPETNVQLAVDPNANAEIKTNTQVEIKAEADPITKVDSKTEVDLQTKSQAETPVQLKLTNQVEQGNPSEPSQSVEEGERPSPSANSRACKKLQKLARRAARREARKAKWAARRIAFRARAHRFGEAAFLPVAIIGGIIFGPVLIAWDLAMCVVSVAGWIVVKIIDLMCAPFMACYYIWRELKW